MRSLPRLAPTRLIAARILILTTLGVGSPFRVDADSAAADSIGEIIFLAGPKDHGWPGRHDYARDLAVLQHSLEQASNLTGIQTRLHVGAAPRDLSFYENAAAIVINSSSDRHEKETHPLFPPNPATNGRDYDNETNLFLIGLDQLIREKQIGVAIFHYANWAENWRARSYTLAWVGGLWVQMVSRNPVDEWTMTPELSAHPALNGVQPWTYRDEIFCRFHLPPDPRRTPLLRGSPHEDKQGIGPQTVAWAYQRDDGGRGFVYGGVDFHDAMNVADYRRFLANAILWTARREVPENGVISPAPNIPPFEPPADRPRRN